MSSGAPAAEAHEHTHADVSGGWLRAAVFGAMDGLVTNTALVAGVGGGGASARAIVLSGVASLVAGAISMALGEYTSVRTQNEQLDLEVEKERREFATGAVIPLLPYLLGFSLLWAALLCGGLGLAAAGALSSRFTPRPWWYAAGRQLLFGAVAAGVTYAIGLAIGVGVS